MNEEQSVLLGMANAVAVRSYKTKLPSARTDPVTNRLTVDGCERNCELEWRHMRPAASRAYA